MHTVPLIRYTFHLLDPQGALTDDEIVQAIEEVKERLRLAFEQTPIVLREEE